MIRVREPVRPRARLGDDGALLECQHGLRRAHEREQRLDRLPALRVRERVRRALGDRELDALGSRKPGEERRRVERGRPQLEVRRAAERERSRAEERAAQVGGAAAAARHDPPRRPLERAVPPVDHAGRRQDSQGVGVAVDVELVARRGVERAAPVGADLRADPAVAEEGERSAGGRPAAEVEVERPVSRPAQVEASRRVEQRGQLRPAVALALGRDPPSSSRTSSDVITGRRPRARAGAA